jgi:hypothetical protein
MSNERTNDEIADMAEATVAALERWPSRQTLIVADDEPVRWRDLFGYVAAMAGATRATASGSRAERGLQPSVSRTARASNRSPSSRPSSKRR